MSEQKKRPGRPRGQVGPKTDTFKRVREALGLTQMEMAVRLKCSLSTVQRCERDEDVPSSGALREMFLQAARQAGVEVPE